MKYMVIGASTERPSSSVMEADGVMEMALAAELLAANGWPRVTITSEFGAEYTLEELRRAIKIGDVVNIEQPPAPIAPLNKRGAGPASA